jgi:hypothetical protein
VEERSIERDRGDDASDRAPSDEHLDRAVSRRPSGRSDGGTAPRDECDPGQASRDPGEALPFAAEQGELHLAARRDGRRAGSGRAELSVVALQSGAKDALELCFCTLLTAPSSEARERPNPPDERNREQKHRNEQTKAASEQRREVQYRHRIADQLGMYFSAGESGT